MGWEDKRNGCIVGAGFHNHHHLALDYVQLSTRETQHPLQVTLLIFFPDPPATTHQLSVYSDLSVWVFPRNWIIEYVGFFPAFLYLGCSICFDTLSLFLVADMFCCVSAPHCARQFINGHTFGLFPPFDSQLFGDRYWE